MVGEATDDGWFMWMIMHTVTICLECLLGALGGERYISTSIKKNRYVLELELELELNSESAV